MLEFLKGLTINHRKTQSASDSTSTFNVSETAANLTIMLEVGSQHIYKPEGKIHLGGMSAQKISLQKLALIHQHFITAP